MNAKLADNLIEITPVMTSIPHIDFSISCSSAGRIIPLFVPQGIVVFICSSRSISDRVTLEGLYLKSVILLKVALKSIEIFSIHKYYSKFSFICYK